VEGRKLRRGVLKNSVIAFVTAGLWQQQTAPAAAVVLQQQQVAVVSDIAAV
jgi:hypothetical protein